MVQMKRRPGRRSQPQAEFTFSKPVSMDMFQIFLPSTSISFSSFGIWSVKSFLGELICSQPGSRPGAALPSHYVHLSAARNTERD